MRQKSHHLQYLEALHFRNGLTLEEEKEYQKLLQGCQGEVDFDKLCQFFSISKEQMLDDITLSLFKNVTQIDKIIISGNVLYLIDVKNYQGNYRYERQRWTLNGNILSNNIFEQLRRAVRIVQQILNQSGIQLSVKGVLVFMNPNSKIDIIDSVDEIVLDVSQIPQWLMSLQPQFIKTTSWQSALKKYQIPNYRTSLITSPKLFSKLIRGVRCINCGSFVTKKQYRFSLECPCGQREAKEIAILRTVCEYSVIRHDKLLKKKDVCQFVGKEYNSHYIREILKKYFRLAKDSKFYENKGVCIDYLFKDNPEYISSFKERIYWKQ